MCALDGWALDMGRQPSAAAAVTLSGCHCRLAPPSAPPAVQLTWTRLGSGPDVETAGSARPASKFAMARPVEPGAQLWVCRSGGWRGWVDAGPWDTSGLSERSWRRRGQGRAGRLCCPDSEARTPAQVPSALPSRPSAPRGGALPAQGLLCS